MGSGREALSRMGVGVCDRTHSHRGGSLHFLLGERERGRGFWGVPPPRDQPEGIRRHPRVAAGARASEEGLEGAMRGQVPPS